MPLRAGTSLGPYTIAALLGAGGMGEVYRAHDARLGRDVAIKVLPAAATRDPERRARLLREARAVAALQHPNICAIYDVGEQDGCDYLVMELLEGESLAARLSRGPLPCDEAVRIARAVLGTLAAVHDRGLLHRDLKPGNIFLTPHGVKLLDFGLARAADDAEAATTALTREGVLLGSPRYMAPEQVKGERLDQRTDLFAAAIILQEMLTGATPFTGTSVVQVAHAIAYDAPAPLPDHLAPPLVRQAIARALDKDPAGRPASARAFAAALATDQDATGVLERGVAPEIAARDRQPAGPTRLIVVPFRLLRPDPDIDFLGFSLADAVASALAGLEALVVRSSFRAARPAEGLDLAALAREAEVDVALTGTLLRAGHEIRLSAQLVEVPNGSIVWSRTIQAPVADLFQLQDTLTHAIVSSLHTPLTARDGRVLRTDVPASAEAYELYLRANGLLSASGQWPAARALYERAVALDPGYAPAWARLGRVLRVMAKYGGPDPAGERTRAERAFERALALNPDLPMAHHFYAYLEAELGRAADAMVRLLTRARTARPDADLFAGLVTTCRYCGLLDASAAAYEHAFRIDPTVRTSVGYTFYLLGDYARTIETDTDLHSFATVLARHRIGEREPAAAALATLEATAPYETARLVAAAYRAGIERRADDARRLTRALEASSFQDPEGFYLLAGILADAGLASEALAILDRVVAGGFHCPGAMRADPFLAALGGDPAFERLLAAADAGHRRARDAYASAGGPRLLGTS